MEKKSFWFLVSELSLSDGLDSLDLTMDENKENQTPEVVQQQGELDWVQQYSLDQEREEQELQQALAQSLQEHVSSLFALFSILLFALFVLLYNANCPNVGQ